jgi:hypothetical protein
MIKTTGNDRIDRATAEIAVALRDASPGQREQCYYDEAMRLRDEIMAGQRELDSGWVRNLGQPGWFIAGHDADPGWLVTDEGIRKHGRAAIEKMYVGLPALPEQAWDVLS